MSEGRWEELQGKLPEDLRKKGWVALPKEADKGGGKDGKGGAKGGVEFVCAELTTEDGTHPAFSTVKATEAWWAQQMSTTCRKCGAGKRGRRNKEEILGERYYFCKACTDADPDCVHERPPKPGASPKPEGGAEASPKKKKAKVKAEEGGGGDGGGGGEAAEGDDDLKVTYTSAEVVAKRREGVTAEQWDALQKTLPDELQAAGWVATVTSQAALNSKHYVFVYTKAADSEQLPCLKGLKRVRRWWELNGEAAAAAAEEEEQPKKKKQKKKLRPSDVAAAAAAAPAPAPAPAPADSSDDEAAAAEEEEEAPEEPPPPPTGMDAVREALRRFRLPELGNKFEAAGYDKLSDLVTLARTKAGAAATLQGDIGIKEAHAVKLVRWLRAPPAGRAIDDLMGE